MHNKHVTGKTMTNLVLVRVGPGGRVSFFTGTGTGTGTVTADPVGYFAP